MWKRLYGRESNRDGGTLLQLRNLLNCSSVPKDPKTNVNACEDFIDVVLTGHILAAGMEVLGMRNMEDVPENLQCARLTKAQKEEKLGRITGAIVSKFVNINLLRQTEESHKKDASKKDASKKKAIRKRKRATPVRITPRILQSKQDCVLEYAKEFLSLGLLHAEFADAIKEGDGGRVLQCWKFFLLFFKASKRKNYSIEALNLLAQHHLLLPPRLSSQLLWSRFVNMHGKAGCNIPCDLHMEHLNRVCKFAIAGLGANVTPRAITRIGRCIGPLMQVCDRYDEEFSLHTLSGAHSMPDLSKDIKAVVKELTGSSSVFHFKEGRSHTSFKSLNGSLISLLDKDELTQWMDSKIANAFDL